jgi:tetratricopeptide (TPR) repeat protein
MPRAAQPFTMRLTANGEEEAILRRGEPLVFAVSLVDYAAVEAAGRRAPRRIGSRRAPWTGMVRFLRVEEGRTQPLRWRLVLLKHPAPDPIAVLDAATSAVADFGVDAAVLDRLSPGRYAIRAAISGRASGRAYEVESNDIVVQLAGRQRRGTRRDLEERRLFAATYAHRRGRYREALAAAQRVIKGNPKNIRARILLGDVYVARRAFTEALSAYRDALAQFRAQIPAIEEEPRPLLSKIEAAARRVRVR